MSSRGHNHPVGCTCRFCEPRGLAKDTQIVTDLISVVGTRYSYTIPIPCPVCGDAVFLYRSKDGGRVFFDELGPPWPKHPCTDRARAALLTTSTDTDQVLPTRHYAWKEAGWQPITDVIVESAGPAHLRLRGLLNSWRLTIYIQISVVAADHDPMAELAHSPIHARKTVDGAFEVAFLSQDLRPRLIRALAQPPDTP